MRLRIEAEFSVPLVLKHGLGSGCDEKEGMRGGRNAREKAIRVL